MAALFREVLSNPVKRDAQPIPSELRRHLQISHRVIGTTLFAAGICLGVGGTYVFRKRQTAASSLIAVVAGTPITRADYYHRMETQAGATALPEMVRDTTLLQFARKNHIFPTDNAVQARAQVLRANSAFAAQVRERKLTEDDMAELCRIQLIQERIGGIDAAVSEQEIQDYYRANTDPSNPNALFYSPETATISIIVTVTEQEARNAERELMAGKAFADVARAHSKDKTGPAGGEAPPIVKGRSFLARDSELEKAVFELKPGGLIHPRKFGQVWIIVRSNRRDPARAFPYEQVREQCRQQAIARKSAKMHRSQLAIAFDEYRGKAPVQIFWEQYYYDLTGQRGR
jgi:hypothetical protein